MKVHSTMTHQVTSFVKTELPNDGIDVMMSNITEDGRPIDWNMHEPTNR